jgi:hypothetical protein
VPNFLDVESSYALLANRYFLITIYFIVSGLAARNARVFQCYFRINIIPTLFYIYSSVFLAPFQMKEKRVSVVTLKVQTTVTHGGTDVILRVGSEKLLCYFESIVVLWLTIRRGNANHARDPRRCGSRRDTHPRS